MRDADIDDSDIPKLDRSFWKHARLTLPEPKDRLTIRVDHDVVEWLKKAGSGYQTRINAILRSYMEAQSDAGTSNRTSTKPMSFKAYEKRLEYRLTIPVQKPRVAVSKYPVLLFQVF